MVLCSDRMDQTLCLCLDFADLCSDFADFDLEDVVRISCIMGMEPFIFFYFLSKNGTKFAGAEMIELLSICQWIMRATTLLILKIST